MLERSGCKNPTKLLEIGYFFFFLYHFPGMVHIEGQCGGWYEVWDAQRSAVPLGLRVAGVNSAAPAACAFLMGSKRANPAMKLLSLADY